MCQTWETSRNKLKKYSVSKIVFTFFTVRINCSCDQKMFANSSALNFKSFSQSPEHFLSQYVRTVSEIKYHCWKCYSIDFIYLKLTFSIIFGQLLVFTYVLGIECFGKNEQLLYFFVACWYYFCQLCCYCKNYDTRSSSKYLFTSFIRARDGFLLKCLLKKGRKHSGG